LIKNEKECTFTISVIGGNSLGNNRGKKEIEVPHFFIRQPFEKEGTLWFGSKTHQVFGLRI